MGAKNSKKDSDAEYIEYLHNTKKKHRMNSLEESPYPEGTHTKTVHSVSLSHSIVKLFCSSS